MNVAIDFCSELFQRVAMTPGRLAVLSGDINSIAADLLLFGEAILGNWLRLLSEASGENDRNRLMAPPWNAGGVFLVLSWG